MGGQQANVLLRSGCAPTPAQADNNKLLLSSEPLVPQPPLWRTPLKTLEIAGVLQTGCSTNPALAENVHLRNNHRRTTTKCCCPPKRLPNNTRSSGQQLKGSRKPHSPTTRAHTHRHRRTQTLTQTPTQTPTHTHTPHTPTHTPHTLLISCS